MKPNRFLILPFFLISLGCASYLKFQNKDRLETDDEYTQSVDVKDMTPPPEPTIKDMPQTQTPNPNPAVTPQPVAENPKSAVSATLKNPSVKTPPKKDKKGVKAGVIEPLKHEPTIEDAESFDGRRPKVDPFRQGEKVTLALSYFGATAGYMNLEVKPFKEVNGRKSYHFYLSAKSSKAFSLFYMVDDWAETFVDYENMVPNAFSIDAKETGQLRNLKVFFDQKTRVAQLWEKKYTKKKGHKEKKMKWKMLPFSQNVLSAAFYMRNFNLVPGKKVAFRVSDEGKNIVFKGQVLRKEKLKTPIGEIDTIVMKPEFEIDGVFSPTGDILFWLTDDDRKFIVRIESKIKIGTIIGQLESIEKGQ
jgi:hypothetical protein